MIEILTFLLAAGVAEDDFIEADARMQTGFAYQQSGLMRRTTARGDDGRWLVLTLWASAEDADAAGTRAKDDPVAIAFDEMLDAASIRRERYVGLD